MSKSLNRFYYESPDGIKYYFWDMLQSHSNIGMEPLKFIEDYGPNQHGSTIRGWRVNPRTITLEFFKEGQACCDTRGELLARLADSMRPNRGYTPSTTGWLRFVNDNEIMMEIPSIYIKGITGDYSYSGNVGRKQVQDNIQFYCADPIWREQKKHLISAGVSTVEACLGEICLASDISYIRTDGLDNCLSASSFFIHQLDVIYTGTWDADQIDIRMMGPMTNPTITNLTLNTKIELEYIIPSGNYVDITIRPEYVTVFDNNGNNLIGSITSISDLVDFVLKTPGSITPSGLNQLVISAVDSSSQSEIRIGYWTRHISAYGNPECNVSPQQNIQDVGQDMIFMTESTGTITPVVVFDPNTPVFNVIWTVIEADGQSYSYNTPGFSHTVSASGISTIVLHKEVTKYVIDLAIPNDNLIGEIDLSPIYNCVALKLNYNNISTVTNLDSLTKLTELLLNDNALTVLDVTNITTLETLGLSANQLSDIGLITNLVNLKYLYLDNNNLTFVGNNINLPDAIHMYLYDNPNLTGSIELGNLGVDLLAVWLLNTQVTLSTASFMQCADVIQLMFRSISPPPNNINFVLQSIWQSRALFNPGPHYLYLDGTNPAPSGIYQAAVIPSTGKEWAFDLANDSNGEGFPLWNVFIN